MFGKDSRVEVAEEIVVGIKADIEVLGTQLEPDDGQITSAATTVLKTASAGKVLLIKRCEYTVNVDQEIAAGAFIIQYKDDGNNAKVISRIWNPVTSSEYGKNIIPDFYKTGTAKTIEIITPAGFSDKLDWVLDSQEIDA